MTDRERLLEILNAPIYPHENVDPLEAVADFLLDNGVTFQRWIPVTERLPDKMCRCICRYVFGENTEYPFYQVFWYFSTNENPHFQDEGSMGMRVTHWMPLPEPPKDDG